MKRPQKIFVGSLADKEGSDCAVWINTLSPGVSESPAAGFGRLKINTLSPNNSLSPASIVIGEHQFDLSREEISILSDIEPGLAENLKGLSIDGLITNRLLTREEILAIDAAKLMAIKLTVLAELYSSNDIRKLLREKIEHLLDCK